MQQPPLSVYIHIPWCIHKCPYCDFNSHEFKDQNIKNNEEAYTHALLKQIENYNIDPNRHRYIQFFLVVEHQAYSVLRLLIHS